MPEIYEGSGSIIAFLSDPDSYPEAPADVEVQETHMARVFLTDRHAYKLKKAISLSFLDYSTPALRREYCEAEIRLNRRLAPSVYLGVVPVCIGDSGRLQLDGPGNPVDWLVKMERLPARYLLDQALTEENVTAAQLEAVSRLLARFYRDAAPLDVPGDRYTANLRKRISDNVHALQEILTPHARQRLDNIAASLNGFIDGERELFSERARRIIDGHGDLRPEHVYFGTPPAVIDCIEFNRDFRANDPIDEIAFLDMECRRKQNRWAGAVFLDAYCTICDDCATQPLMSFYRGHRALLRAKLALWHLEDYPDEPAKWYRKADEYLAVALDECSRLKKR